MSDSILRLESEGMADKSDMWAADPTTGDRPVYLSSGTIDTSGDAQRLEHRKHAKVCTTARVSLGWLYDFGIWPWSGQVNGSPGSGRLVETSSHRPSPQGVSDTSTWRAGPCVRALAPAIWQAAGRARRNPSAPGLRCIRRAGRVVAAPRARSIPQTRDSGGQKP